MLPFYLFIFQLWILYTKSEFEKMESTETFELYFAKSPQDCSYEGKSKNFPELYNVSSNDIDLGPPSSFHITYFEKAYVKRSVNYFYPGMNLEIYPPGTGTEALRGYEIDVTWKNNVACLIYVLNQTAEQHEEITTELYPVTEMMSFWFTLTSLPPLNLTQSLAPVQLVTSVGYYKNPRTILPLPADWYSPRIAYDVLRCDESRCVQIVFARPPPEYGFQRYQIALVPVEDYINVRTNVTSRFFHEFKEVESGHYKITVKAIDDYFSQSGRCLCHDYGGCTNCLSSETSIFVVE